MHEEERDKGVKSSSKDLQTEQAKEKTFEERKKAAYSAMGRLGGLARAKQMAEKGFSITDKLKSYSTKSDKTKKDEEWIWDT